jgi:hypothetical protein
MQHALLCKNFMKGEQGNRKQEDNINWIVEKLGTTMQVAQYVLMGGVGGGEQQGVSQQLKGCDLTVQNTWYTVDYKRS